MEFDIEALQEFALQNVRVEGQQYHSTIVGTSPIVPAACTLISSMLHVQDRRASLSRFVPGTREHFVALWLLAEQSGE